MNCIIRTGNESGKESGAVELLKGRPMAYAGIAALTAAALCLPELFLSFSQKTAGFPFS